MRHRASLLLVGLLVACSADTTVPVTDAGAASSRTMRGLYSYMADAGMFVECGSDQRLPVAMEADNLALERAYLNSRTTPGAPLLVSVEGRIEMRPKLEGDGLERTLVPLKFNSAWPGQDCTWSPGATESPMMSLTSTRWLLADSRLAAAPPDDRGRVHLEFTTDRMSASSGCNTGSAGYRIEGGALALGPMATTRMACVGAAAQYEPAFFAFLAARPLLTTEAGDLVLEKEGARLLFRSVPMPSAAAIQKFIYVASERKPCTGGATMECLQIREQASDPWQLYYGEIIGFVHEPGIEYRLRILEDEVPNPPADASSKRWFLNMVVEQRVITR
jgi:heat shock protein HslJ